MENKHNFSNSQNLKFKVKVKVVVAQSCPTLCHPMFCSPPGSSVHGILQARILEGIDIFFLQGIFPIQELNLGLPHCRQILYHLSHQGELLIFEFNFFSLFLEFHI